MHICLEDSQANIINSPSKQILGPLQCTINTNKAVLITVHQHISHVKRNIKLYYCTLKTSKQILLTVHQNRSQLYYLYLRLPWLTHCWQYHLRPAIYDRPVMQRWWNHNRQRSQAIMRPPARVWQMQWRTYGNSVTCRVRTIVARWSRTASGSSSYDPGSPL